MPTEPPKSSSAPESVYPLGWFAVVPIHKLRAGATHAFQMSGRRWVAYRTKQGVAKVASNRCPHLGGRLDLDSRVVGEQLECGLHRYRFGVDGRPSGRHGDACPLARNLTVLPTIEHAGMVFAWYDEDGLGPRFELPAHEDEGWTDWKFRSIEVASQPRFVMQDLADALHFETIHDFGKLFDVEGPTYGDYDLRLFARFGWDTGLPGTLSSLPASFKASCHGLGYQYTETASVWEQYLTRHLILPTPIDQGRMKVHLGVSAKLGDKVPRFVPKRIVNRLAHEFVSMAFRRDVARDARLWAGQTPDPSSNDPVEVPADPAILEYRQWATRFHPQASEAQA